MMIMNEMNSTRDPGTSWKKSAFTMVLGDDERGHVMHNSITGHTLNLTARQHDALQAFFCRIAGPVGASDQALLTDLAALGFVVPMGEDEERREHERFLAHQHSQERLYLTIAPTMACNLQCTYCFQQDMVKSRTMSPEIQAEVIRFVGTRLTPDTRLVVVQWFGGEPLMALDAVRSMTEKLYQACEVRGISYTAEMLTNGTLMTREFIRDLPQLHLSALQIPLDGSPATYARRKQVSAPRAERLYQSLIENLSEILDVIGSVTIRINVDRNNVDAGKEVVDMFHLAGVIDDRIDFRLGFLNTQRDVVDCIPHDCFRPSEFAATERDFQAYIADRGYRVYGRPAHREHPCIAPLHNAYTIDPTGRIGKCVPAMGTDRTAFAGVRPEGLEDTLRAVQQSHPLADFDPFISDVCGGCPLLPACLGSCPRSHAPDRSVICPHELGLEEKLRLFAGLPAVRHQPAVRH